MGGIECLKSQNRDPINSAQVTAKRELDPFRLQPGLEMDTAIHTLLFGLPDSGVFPHYSTDLKEAEKVRVRVKVLYDASIVTGRTRIRGKPWFARYDSDPSTCTEVVAETPALAICRLALVRHCRESA